MADQPQHDEAQPTQKTLPKKGKPMEIPVPKREEFQKVLKRAARGSTTRRTGK